VSVCLALLVYVSLPHFLCVCVCVCLAVRNVCLFLEEAECKGNG